ncbi:hypothetical protein HWV62_32690 [Athelia sp. TMB]|nr:hypothetical protein HWV62_32690 [Athelia sp. TMB]
MADPASTGLGVKRSASPTDSIISKRLKLIANARRLPEAADSPRVSRILFDTSEGPQLGDPQFRSFYGRLVESRRNALALEGKRVVGCLAGLWLVYDPTAKLEAQAQTSSAASSSAQDGRSALDAIHIDDEDDERDALQNIPVVQPMSKASISQRSPSVCTGDQANGSSSRMASAPSTAKQSPKQLPVSSLPTPIYIEDSDSDVEDIEAIPSATNHITTTSTYGGPPARFSALVMYKNDKEQMEDDLSMLIPGLDEPESDEEVDPNTLADMAALSSLEGGFHTTQISSPLIQAVDARQRSHSDDVALLERAFASDWEEPSSDMGVEDELTSDEELPIVKKSNASTMEKLPSHTPLENTNHEEERSSESDDSGSSGDPSHIRRRQTTHSSRSRHSTRPTSAEFSDEDIINPHKRSSPHSLPKSLPRRKILHRNVSNSTYARSPASSISLSTSSSSSVILPSASNARPRRLLVPGTEGLPLVAVTMRGDVNFLDPGKDLISLWSIPNKGKLRHVEDACMVRNTAVIGHNEGPQISIIDLLKNEKPRQRDLKQRPHENGVSCIAALPYDPAYLRFITGGRDKKLCIWELEEGGQDPRLEPLPLLHNSMVQAISYRSIDQKILSGSGQNIYTTDLRTPQLIKTARLSNRIYNIHTHPQDANLSILEVCAVALTPINPTQLLAPGRPPGFPDPDI